MEMSSSCNSTSSSSNSRQKRIYDEGNPCECGYASRVWISSMKENPGKRFRTCPNSLDTKKKNCKYWEWVDEEEGNCSEVDLRRLEREFKLYQLEKDNESNSFRQEIDKISRQVYFQKCCILILLGFFVARVFV